MKVKTPVMLDTSVASFVFGDSPQAEPYRRAMAGRVLTIAFQVEAELLTGAYEHGWGARRRAALERFIANHVVVYPDQAVVSEWARLRAALRRSGRIVETADLWIAAVAVAKDTVLLSHDGVFRQVPGLRLVCQAPT